LLFLDAQRTNKMNINTERDLLIEELRQVQDLSLLRAIKAMLHYGLKNEGRISLDQYNRELDEAEARIEQGDFLTQEEVEKLAKKW
jgi:hypothetical protein